MITAPEHQFRDRSFLAPARIDALVRPGASAAGEEPLELAAKIPIRTSTTVFGRTTPIAPLQMLEHDDRKTPCVLQIE